MRWERTGCSTTDEGTTITYELPRCPLRIESRKRHIPHADRSGTWDYTTFFVMRGNEEIAERQTLADAKRIAERYVMDRGLTEDGPDRT